MAWWVCFCPAVANRTTFGRMPRGEGKRSSGRRVRALTVVAPVDLRFSGGVTLAGSLLWGEERLRFVHRARRDVVLWRVWRCQACLGRFPLAGGGHLWADGEVDGGRRWMVARCLDGGCLDGSRPRAGEEVSGSVRAVAGSGSLWGAWLYGGGGGGGRPSSFCSSGLVGG